MERGRSGYVDQHGGWRLMFPTHKNVPYLPDRSVSENPYTSKFQKRPPRAAGAPSAVVPRPVSRSAHITTGGEGTSELQELLIFEHSLRLAAERRILEEKERGARAAIVLEATHGACLLHAILIEASATSPQVSGTVGFPRRAAQTLLSGASNFNHNTVRLASKVIDDNYERIVDENRQLSEQIMRYKSIEAADRQEINELYGNMRCVIDNLTRERDALHAELTRIKKTGGDASRENCSREGLAAASEGLKWHQTHIIDPFRGNSEEPPGHERRLRVLPFSQLEE